MWGCQGQRVFSIAFHEVVRQVSVTCIERGQLLAKVWSCYMRLFDLVERISDPLRDDVRLLREKLATEVHRRQDQEAETQRRDETISKLEATIQVRGACLRWDCTRRGPGRGWVQVHRRPVPD